LRQTTRLTNRYPLALDLNPIAVALTKAKNVTITSDLVYERIEELRERYDSVLYLPEAHVQLDDIQLIYHPRTLAQLCYLRRRLVRSDNAVDQFLVGAVLGVMHGNERQDGSSGYASISMPNTFSMSPRYVRRFIETKRLNRTPREVFDILANKVTRLFSDGAPIGEGGKVITANVKELIKVPEFAEYKGKVRLIITSPPYLDIVNYAKQNWIRNWFMDIYPDRGRVEELDDELTLTEWIRFTEESVMQMKEMLVPDGVITFVIGDVVRPSGGLISLAREFIQRILHDGIFKYVGCFADPINDGIKTTRIWKETKGRATNTDRIVILSDMRPEFRYQRLSEALYGYSKAGMQISPIDATDLEHYALSFAQRDGRLQNPQALTKYDSA
jgi:hypothetical protein